MTKLKHADITSYNAALEPSDREISELLRTHIDRALPDAQSKIWHGHPVWFLNDGNPIVGYDKLKHSMRLLFWSGQSFDTPGLSAEGTFKAAELRMNDVAEIDLDTLEKWLAEARTVQWNYRDIRRNRGQLERL